MKVQIPRSELKEAVAGFGKIVNGKASALPILGGVRFENDGHGTTGSVTDLDQHLRFTFAGAKATGKGAFVVPLAALRDLMKTGADKEPIEFETGRDDVVTVTNHVGGHAVQHPLIDRTTIEDVLEATRIHLRALRAVRRKGRIDGSLGDVIDGLGISADKLRLALEDAGRQGAPRVVVSVAGGVVTGVMSGVPGLRAEVFDFDDRVEELADGEFRGEPNSGKAADKADREFHEATKGMADALAATAHTKGRVKR